MSGFGRRLLCIFGFLGVLVAAPAVAQESLDTGKAPAQLFAANCAICHKSPQGLTKGVGILGLENFLREHYTVSRESAAAIARYLQAVDKAAPAPKRATKRDDKAKGAEKKPETGKSGEGKSGEGKSGERKPAAAKPSESKPSESKPSESKTSEPKASEPKASETKPSESKPSEPKPSEPKPSEPKASEPKPAEAGKSD